MDETAGVADGTTDLRVGAQLQRARLARGEDLNDIATRTRIPLRHLEAIERDAFAELPSPTYALGFVRSYARALDLAETPLIDGVRRELGRPDPHAPVSASYEPADPARVPGKLLAWTALALAVLAAFAYAWATGRIGASADRIGAPSAAPDVVAGPVPPAARGAGARSAQGQVTLTAKAPVWIQVSDGGGKPLISRELAQGERYDVPRDANAPVIKTGRADQIAVTVNGSDVAPLGPAQRTIRDVPISATALLARAAPPAAVAGAAKGSVAAASNARAGNPQ